MNRVLPGLLVMLVLLAACAAPGGAPPAGSDRGASPGSSGGGDGGVGDGIGHPTGSDPIFVVESAGGFMPVEFMATQTPAFVLLGDGRVIMLGPQTLEFPGPALPPLIERTLTEEGVQELLGAIEATNLFTSDLELAGAQGVVADAANTIFRLDAAGRQVTVSVYGLGTLTPDMDPPPGMSSSELEAHRILTELNDALMTVDTWLPGSVWESEGWQPYEPEALRLYVRDATGEPVEGGDVPAQVRDWPTDDDPATFGEEEEFFGNGTRCGVVEGEDAATWLAELNAATVTTRWTTDGDNRFSVMARPVLPHEDPACPPLAGGA